MPIAQTGNATCKVVMMQKYIKVHDYFKPLWLAKGRRLYDSQVVSTILGSGSLYYITEISGDGLVWPQLQSWLKMAMLILWFQRVWARYFVSMQIFTKLVKCAVTRCYPVCTSGASAPGHQNQ